MTKRIIIAGFGGQGVMLLGKVIAQAAMEEDRFVTWLPSYGAEVRGGTAHCMVVLSDHPIGSAYIEKADISIILNGPSLLRFKDRIQPKGFLVLNSSLVPPYRDAKRRIAAHPFTDIALQLGNTKVANMVALGCVLGIQGVVCPETVTRVIAQIAPESKRDLIEINRKALKKGMELR
ncbi:MAG: 2-oxoacid:acceptor oxidoreductase family protein [Candidatus Omnitrophica bacterium]|nr:2-oxoacid:acceptor oxidoreductase family protein [Candidatus Omnitrophota bacterium]